MNKLKIFQKSLFLQYLGQAEVEVVVVRLKVEVEAVVARLKVAVEAVVVRLKVEVDQVI